MQSQPNLSPDQLKRCRSMEIIRNSESDLNVVIMKVFDPRSPGRVMKEYRARTKQDVERVRRAFMQKYRIPVQNITEVDAAEKQ